MSDDISFPKLSVCYVPTTSENNDQVQTLVDWDSQVGVVGLMFEEFNNSKLEKCDKIDISHYKHMSCPSKCSLLFIFEHDEIAQALYHMQREA
jgi:hypothetical protein